MDQLEGKKILDWYDLNKRDLPWRDDLDPYKIWISEIILQQTRVDQGFQYYLRFITRFPNVVSLADADEQEVLLLWQGLGYYSRARNLHFSAKLIRDKWNGVFPNRYEDIISLKGVGEYTAAAISSIAFNHPKVSVDGNVIRVISRLYGIETLVEKVSDKKEIEKLAFEMMPFSRPGDFNQALMELGAIVCTPAAVKCVSCPLKSACVAFSQNKVGQIPPPKKRVKQRKRFFHFLVLDDDKYLLIQKRTGADIWKSLYAAPMIEVGQRAKVAEAGIIKKFERIFNCSFTLTQVSEPVKHVLTHQQIWATFYHVKLVDSIQKLSLGSCELIERNDLDNYPLPRLIDKYLASKL